MIRGFDGEEQTIGVNTHDLALDETAPGSGGLAQPTSLPPFVGRNNFYRIVSPEYSSPDPVERKFRLHTCVCRQLCEGQLVVRKNGARFQPFFTGFSSVSWF